MQSCGTPSPEYTPLPAQTLAVRAPPREAPLTLVPRPVQHRRRQGQRRPPDPTPALPFQLLQQTLALVVIHHQIVRAVGLEEIPHPHHVGVIELGQGARFVQKGLQPDLEQCSVLWRVRGQGAPARLSAHQLARSVGPRAGSTRPSHAAPDPARCLCVVRVAAYFAGTILQSVRGVPGKAADCPPQVWAGAVRDGILQGPTAPPTTNAGASSCCITSPW